MSERKQWASRLAGALPLLIFFIALLLYSHPRAAAPITDRIRVDGTFYVRPRGDTCELSIAVYLKYLDRPFQRARVKLDGTLDIPEISSYPGCYLAQPRNYPCSAGRTYEITVDSPESSGIPLHQRLVTARGTLTNMAEVVSPVGKFRYHPITVPGSIWTVKWRFLAGSGPLRRLHISHYSPTDGTYDAVFDGFNIFGTEKQIRSVLKYFFEYRISLTLDQRDFELLGYVVPGSKIIMQEEVGALFTPIH